MPEGSNCPAALNEVVRRTSSSLAYTVILNRGQRRRNALATVRPITPLPITATDMRLVRPMARSKVWTWSATTLAHPKLKVIPAPPLHALWIRNFGPQRLAIGSGSSSRRTANAVRPDADQVGMLRAQQRKIGIWKYLSATQGKTIGTARLRSSPA